MISPLPRNKRAKNPRQVEGGEEVETSDEDPAADAPKNSQPNTVPVERKSKRESEQAGDKKSGDFTNNPFAQIETK